jgi:hypothetical protein
LRQAREDVGYSAAQIARLEAEDAEAAAVDPTLAAVARTLTQPQPVAPAAQAVPGAAPGAG